MIKRKMGFDGVYLLSSASKGSNNIRILSRSVAELVRSASDEDDHSATH